MRREETGPVVSHTFAVCAYGVSPYLEACLSSLKRQTVPADIIICTSTPNPHILAAADRYGLPLFIRKGAGGIREDWNFAYQSAASRLVTLAHQDDCYHKTYAASVQRCWKKYPDTTVFMTGCVVKKNGTVRSPGLIEFVKRFLRAPLCLHGLADREMVKKAAFIFGNPVICPSCTYDKQALGEPLFTSPFQFALDWDTMWRLASLPGRFYCLEKPLLCYRVHAGSQTKKCIENNLRAREETEMFAKIWPRPIVRLLMQFYQRAYDAYS